MASKKGMHDSTKSKGAERGKSKGIVNHFHVSTICLVAL